MVSDHSYLSTESVVESSTGQAFAPVAKTSQGPIPPSFWISGAKVKPKPTNPKDYAEIPKTENFLPLFKSYQTGVAPGNIS